MSWSFQRTDSRQWSKIMGLLAIRLTQWLIDLLPIEIHWQQLVLINYHRNCLTAYHDIVHEVNHTWGQLRDSFYRKYFDGIWKQQASINHKSIAFLGKQYLYKKREKGKGQVEPRGEQRKGTKNISKTKKGEAEGHQPRMIFKLKSIFELTSLLYIFCWIIQATHNFYEPTDVVVEARRRPTISLGNKEFCMEKYISSLFSMVGMFKQDPKKIVIIIIAIL